MPDDDRQKHHLRERDPDLWGRMTLGEQQAYHLGGSDATLRAVDTLHKLDGPAACPNCHGTMHEGDGSREDDYPCRTCMASASAPSQGAGR
ncbi:MAG: hypothetical protein JWO98_5146 [Frankiales bacterium]|nr:hypothetical protein [Frankiales bacterium]